MKVKTFWISFDLGIRGDYSGLYAWLDSVGAKECGDNLAVFKKKYNGNPLKSILAEIKKYVAHRNKTDRIYLIYRDDNDGLIKGSFLVGRRKRAPWEGYAEDIKEISVDF